MTQLSGKSVLTRVAANTKGTWVDDTRKYVGAWDEQLWIPTETDLVDLGDYVSGFFKLAHVSYVTESFDCEDIALLFMSMARLRGSKLGHPSSACVGLAYGKFSWRNEAHCTNWAIVERPGGTLELCWIEPQDVLKGADLRSVLRPFSNKEHSKLTVMIV